MQEALDILTAALPAGHPDIAEVRTKQTKSNAKHMNQSTKHTTQLPVVSSYNTTTITNRCHNTSFSTPYPPPPQHLHDKPNAHQNNTPKKQALGNVAEVHRRREDYDRALPLFQGAIQMKKAAVAARGEGRVGPMDAMGA